MNNAMDDQRAAKLSRTTPLFLFLVFLAPLVLATLIYFYHDRLPSPGTKNHGELIHPAMPLTQFEARTENDEIIALDYLKGKWTYLYVGTYRCNLHCEAALYKTRQARLAQGENLRRVQRLYLINAIDSSSELPEVLEHHPRMTVASLKEEAQEQILKTLGDASTGTVFLIDPLGNLMMRYNDEATAKGMIKDLQHLIKASRIG